MGMEVWLTKAGIGDCILVRCGNEDRKINILIDSGQGAGTLEKALKRIISKNEQLELLVLTHDDNDHVKGACNLLERLHQGEEEIKDQPVRKLFAGLTEERILFNFGGNGTDRLLGAKDVKKLSRILEGEIDFHKLGFVLGDETKSKERPCPNMFRLRWEMKDGKFLSDLIKSPGEEDFKTKMEQLSLVILTPGKQRLIDYINSAWETLNGEELLSSEKKEEKRPGEWEKSIQYWLDHPMELGKDTKPANNASISFLLCYKGHCALFAGDASPGDMVSAGKEYLKNCGLKEDGISLDFIKLPHHGSSHNISREFLKFFRTKHYLISTCGHSGYKHPGKGTLAEIAAVLKPGEQAEIYSSYEWWGENSKFKRAEFWEDNWSDDESLCTLTDSCGGVKYLKFHLLDKEMIEIKEGISLSI